MQLSQHPHRYLRAPRLVASGAGAHLYVIAWEGGQEHVVRYTLDARGDVVAEPMMLASHAQIVALDPSQAEQPSQDALVELCAVAGPWRVEISHGQGRSQVWAQRASGARWLVWSGYGIAAAPAVAATTGGVWVAFHHDVREDTLSSDVAKWIALRFVDDSGQVMEPAAEMVGRDRDQHGVEQCFEFPSLAVSPHGAVSLFGRGSHNFWRQDLSAQGWLSRTPLSDGEWGSRGRRVSALTLPDGWLLAAYRERHAIEVQRLPPAVGGTPALRPATTDVTGLQASGATVLDRSADPARRHGTSTYFGDIQQHSAHSDGTGAAEEAYLRARWRYADDFVALTDHESFLGKRTGPGEWAYLQAVAERYDEPGAFATLIAYEWTGRRYPGPGHKCVYLPRSGLPLISRDDVPEGRDLVERIRALNGFASPHHIGWTGADEPGHEPAGQPVWEICSCHGCYEHADHPLGQRGELTDQMVDVMLRRGHRFGFTASSDSHGLLWHHGESRKRDPYRTGLTAVQATGLTRSAIMDALMKRRCYATSGAKILLDFTADGAPMGSELRRVGPAQLRAEVVGTAEIARLELVTPQHVHASSEIRGTHALLEATLETPWAYARVTQSDGEMAWSSPIFFDD